MSYGDKIFTAALNATIKQTAAIIKQAIAAYKNAFTMLSSFLYLGYCLGDAFIEKPAQGHFQKLNLLQRRP